MLELAEYQSLPAELTIEVLEHNNEWILTWNNEIVSIFDDRNACIRTLIGLLPVEIDENPPL